MEIIDTKDRGEKVVIEEIKDPAHIWIQMKEFKKQNGWRTHAPDDVDKTNY